ncbi:MAG TPA: hypothetical protein VIK81_04005 [Patescibacteria group bacterium]
MPDEDHGNPKNITNKTFDEAAGADGSTTQDAKRNTQDLLVKESGLQTE